MDESVSVRIDDKTVYFLFKKYGETRFTIEPVSHGLKITGRYFTKDGEAESSIGVSVIDQHTIRVDTV